MIDIREKNIVAEAEMEIYMPKGLVVAGTHSGSGKTTVSLGILAALKKRGYEVAPFKIGPDFIDPGHHRQITGRPSHNLDGWMLPEPENRKIFARGIAGADLVVVEGVMGLFDGYDGRSEAGSTAQMAKWLGLDILLVVDARSMARSAAAIVFGFTEFDISCRFCGVVFNRVGSERHMDYLRQAIEDNLPVKVLGGLPENPDLKIPERHLGLVTAEDHIFGEDRASSLAKFIEHHLDLGRLIELIPRIGIESVAIAENSRGADDEKKYHAGNELFLNTKGKNVRIGVARDNAFCFYYQDNLDLLEKCGAEMVFFSPVNDEILPDELDGLYLGGGYPELHADQISRNIFIRKAIYDACKNGMPIYGECGGFMYLCEKLVAGDGAIYDMAGCFPFTSRMSTRRTALGYREIMFSGSTPLGGNGLTARGHEFHYSFLETEKPIKEIQKVYKATDRSGADRGCPGYLVNRCLGSYVHLHFRSCPAMAHHFVSVCRKYQTEREEKNASYGDRT